MRLVRCAQLVEDFAIYPRHDVDRQHVANLTRAIRAGIELPPIIIERKTKRIVDGFHRVRATIQVGGPTAEIMAIEKTYPSEADLLRDAIESNASHGRRLDAQDRTRCVLLLSEHKLTDEQIAVSLHTTKQDVERLRFKVVLVEGEVRPAKPVIRSQLNEDMREVTEEQYQVARSSSGWSALRNIRQLTRELDAGVVEMTDAVVEALEALDAAVERALERHKAVV